MLILRYTLIVIVCAFVFPICSFGQVGGEEDFELDDECFLKNKDFEFQLLGERYADRSTTFLCSENMPTFIDVIDVNTGESVVGEFEWEKNGVVSDQTSNGLIISDDDVSSDFNSKRKLKIKAKFNGNIQIRFTIWKNFVTFVGNHNVNTYEFDNNNIEEYIGINYDREEAVGTPWNFILIKDEIPSASETLMGMVHFENGINKLNNIEGNTVNLQVNPNSFTSNEQNITFTHSILQEVDDYEIEVDCCNRGPDLLLYAGRKIEFDVELYRVCESDDDIQVTASGTAPLPGEVCIDGGVDLTIDLMYKPGFVKGDDELTKDGSKYVITAGVNGICESDILNRGQVPPRITCPDIFDHQGAENAMNDILRKVGVEANVNFNVNDLAINYDVVEDDDLLSFRTKLSNGVPILDEDNSATNEVEAFRYKRFTIDNVPASDVGPVRAYIISSSEDKNGTTLGGTAGLGGLGMNNLLLTNLADGTTFLHEIGHAKWSFAHPRQANPLYGRSAVTDDFKNFMFFTRTTGSLDDPKNPLIIRENNIRRYQFNIIRNND